MANPISYVLFGIFIWWLFKFCERHAGFEGGLKAILKYLYCFLWPISFFSVALIYYGKRSEGIALLFAILGIVTSVAAVVVVSNDPGKTYRAIKAFISRFF
ncbi:hypothetical protein [Morganella morganii]|uniref:hypothetical protein n=1 Tax=Morganella morganii TaxID=582 RepID=UPI00069A55A6|nr:hypothetical protein [Morganella morganii]KNZ89997.1 hypothetical protein AKG16_02055 [Morganella morganii]